MSVCVYLLIVRTLEDYPFRAKGYSNKPINQLYTPTHNILVMLKPWSNKCQGRHSVARIGLWTLVRYLGLCSLCFLRQLRALCSSQFCNSFHRDHGVHGLNFVLSIKNASTVAPGLRDALLKKAMNASRTNISQAATKGIYSIQNQPALDGL